MFNHDYEVPSARYFCVCFNLLLSAFISVLRQKFLIAYLTPLQTFFAHIVLANNSFCLFRTCKLFFPYFSSPPPSWKIIVRPLLTMNWSIWLTVFPFGDLQLSLWMSLCRGITETYHPFPAVFETKFNKPFSIVVDGSATLLTHCIFSPRRCCHLQF